MAMAVPIAMSSLLLRSPDCTWNRQRWLQLPDDGNRYEVIDGVLYMSTAPTVFHQWIIRRLFEAFSDQIDGAGIGTTLWAPIGLFMPGCDPVQPDVLVLRQEDVRPETFRDGHIYAIPALLVEVLSPNHPTHDTRVKREAYAKAGVPEYWIVRPATRDVLVCAQPDNTLADYGRTMLFGPNQELVSPTLPVRLAVAELFANAPDTTV